MRGKAVCTRFFQLGDGITPAYAGKSDRIAKLSYAMKGSPPPMRGKVIDIRQRQAKRRDHPRLCGEKFPSPSPPTYAEGSPPPMRGKAIAAFPRHHASRITPAYAGKSGTLGIFMPGSLGSPPPMRGKGAAGNTGLETCRITPAYAGKSR